MRLHCRRHAVYLCHVSLVLGIGSWLSFHGVLALTYPTSLDCALRIAFLVKT